MEKQAQVELLLMWFFQGMYLGIVIGVGIGVFALLNGGQNDEQ